MIVKKISGKPFKSGRKFAIVSGTIEKEVKGIIISRCSLSYNLYNFLCLCDDQETWMRDTVVIPSPITLNECH
jgi:hypothetical protein